MTKLQRGDVVRIKGWIQTGIVQADHRHSKSLKDMYRGRVIVEVANISYHFAPEELTDTGKKMVHVLVRMMEGWRDVWVAGEPTPSISVRGYEYHQRAVRRFGVELTYYVPVQFLHWSEESVQLDLLECIA